VAWTVYDQFKLRQNNGNSIDLDNPSGTFKILLCAPAYTPDQDAHVFHSDLTNEVTGTGYTAGGNAVANPLLSHNTGSGLITFDGDDPADWLQDAGGFTDARVAVLYHDTGVSGTSVLLAYNDFGANKNNVDHDLSVEMDAAGILQWPR
jgi:hypothetical protein